MRRLFFVYKLCRLPIKNLFMCPFILSPTGSTLLLGLSLSASRKSCDGKYFQCSHTDTRFNISSVQLARSTVQSGTSGNWSSSDTLVATFTVCSSRINSTWYLLHVIKRTLTIAHKTTYSKGNIEPLQRFGWISSLRDLGEGCRPLSPKWPVGLFWKGLARIERQIASQGSNSNVRRRTHYLTRYGGVTHVECDWFLKLSTARTEWTE